jgi:Phage major capsid protein E
MSTIALPSMFEAAELTNVLDLMQIQYGTITQMGMFPFMGMATRYAAIRRSEQGLCLVPAAEWCGPPRAANKRKKTDMIFIEVPHTPIIDVVHPCDVMGRPTYDLNTPMGLKTMADEVNERMASMRAKLEITAEYRRVRALFGEVLDSDGSVLNDLYSDFGYSPTNIAWALSDPNFDLQTACLNLKRVMRKSFKGVYNGVDVMVDSKMFDLVTTHPSAREAYKRCCDTIALVTGDNRMNGFPFGGLRFWEYDGEACAITDPIEGTTETRQFMASPLDSAGDEIAPDGIGIAYPTGAPNTYETLGAPPTMNDFVNQRAQSEYYASMEPRCHNEGFELKMQMNTLPIMKQPNALIRLIAE